MPEQKRIRALAPYLPWVVLVFGILISLLTSRIFAAHEYVEVGWATELAAEAIRTDLREDMEWQRIGLDRLALLWDKADPAQQLWIENAELYIQHRPGCLAVEWVLPDGSKRGIVSATRAIPELAYDGIPKAAMEAAQQSRSAVYSNPAAVGDRAVQYAIAYPVYVRNQLRGFIVSYFDAARAIEENLGDVRNLGFSFGVGLPGQAEYVMPGMNRQYEAAWGQVYQLELPGVVWRLRVWPNPDALYRIRSALPMVTLALGAVLSLLAALTIFFAIGIVNSSRHITDANQALQREIAVREGTELELRRAQSELDVRVHDRTAELAATNALLKNKVAEQETTEAMLRELTGRLFHLQDEERRHLARELHDGAVQNLAALSLDIAMIRDACAVLDESTKELVNECSVLTDQATKELRTISYLLHPPYFDELGLRSALRDFVEGFRNRSGIEVTLDIDPRLERLSHDLELTIYRVVQEALSNVHRHSHSRTAHIVLECQRGVVRLEITDTGHGISREIMEHQNGVGLAGMRERVRIAGGRFEIRSAQTGTTIEAFLPVVNATAEPEMARANISASQRQLPWGNR